MKVRQCFQNPDYSDFTKACVNVGEAIESAGFHLDEEMPENYSQGEQTFSFTDGKHQVTLIISEEE